MFEQKETLVVSKGYKFYEFLLLLYPVSYRKKFGQEMLITFSDLYQEKVMREGKIGLRFWLRIGSDLVLSTITQHYEIAKKQGMKKYLRQTLHFNTYNLIGVILLLPFMILLGTDFLGRLAQGDLMHYNRALYGVMSHTILYSTFNGQAYLLWIALIVAPTSALVLNFIPVMKTLLQWKKVSLRTLFFNNPFSIVILAASTGALLVIYGHDFFPCVVHGLLNGSVNKEHILSICRNA